jgi:uncharacterized protein YktB (UPF0637 family)
MKFAGFSKEDFETFEIEGLEARMQAIQERIQPKFRAIGEKASADLSMSLGNEMYLHIAKHARRKVNPPKDTWMAIANNKRGYKQHPHFQVGLFDDHVFIWLAFIYEVPNKQEIAKKFLANVNKVHSTIPDDFVISLDHMKKDALPVKELSKVEFKASLERFRDIKSAELLIGRHIDANDPILQHGDRFMKLIQDTFTALIPLYQMAYS